MRGRQSPTATVYRVMLGYKKGVEIEVKSYSHIQGLDGSPIPVNKTSISTPMRIVGACLYAHTCICKNADAIVFYLQEYILNRQVWDMEDNRKLHLFCIVYAFTAASRLTDRASALVRCKGI